MVLFTQLDCAGNYQITEKDNKRVSNFSFLSATMDDQLFFSGAAAATDNNSNDEFLNFFDPAPLQQQSRQSPMTGDSNSYSHHEAIESNLTPQAILARSTPVSYTHLDVYKRQI